MNHNELVPTPPRSDINTGLSPANHATMIRAFGTPGRLTRDCSEVTNPALAAHLKTKDVGPFRVTGHVLALEDLAAIFAKVKAEVPDLYLLLGTEGMLCCRAVRNSTTHFSNHSWGTAIDLKIGGLLSPFNARKVPRGLVTLYSYFHAQGWFWAAGYNGRTDPMHFEVSNERVKKWKEEGLLG